MKILLLAPDYLNLYKLIILELERQGHEVVYFEDIDIEIDSRVGWAFSRKNKFRYFLNNPYRIYWKQMFKKLVFKEKYDMLFCINGRSFHPVLLKKLKTNGCKIRSVLYVWDSQKYADYLRKSFYFDKVYTFDYEDSKTYNVGFLPFFWIPSHTIDYTPSKYKMSIVGTNHDGRATIVSKVAEQLDALGYNYYFKLYGPFTPQSLQMTHLMSYEEVVKIMKESDVILDTDRATQTGTTPRVIWALALGKRVVSTNSHLKEMPFYDEKCISIIDRDYPKLDVGFISGEINEAVRNTYIESLRIDIWLDNFLY